MQQKLVMEYLTSVGCDIGEAPDSSGYVRFKCIGSEHMAGYLYPEGVVHIFSEHTAPFPNATNSFYEVMVAYRGETFAKAALKHASFGVTAKKKAKAEDVRVEEESEPTERPPILTMISSARAPRTSATMVKTKSIIEWIKCPPLSWYKLRTKNSLTTMKTKFTPCLVRDESTPTTIGWLDFDKKENTKIDLDKVIESMRDDKHVLAIFKSLSGNGYAVGVGIKYTTKAEYEAAMRYAVKKFEATYHGVHIDKTCIRFKQLRALSYDPNIFVRDSALFFRGYTMLPVELTEEMDKIDSQLDGIRERAKTKKEDFNCEPTMIEELDVVYDELEINISEDVWTGKREYSIAGNKVRDMNALYLAMMDKLMSRNSNAYHLKKTELCDYMQTRIDVHDKVLQAIFTKPWDKVDRWPELQKALHLSDFDLHAFKLWMRQGAALLYNKGEATDVQRNFMLILYSKNQHIGKTELVKKMSCGTNSFTQKTLNTTSKDAMVELYSNWIYEYGELGSQFRKSDINTLKSFITDSAVTYRRPYDREATTFPVRTSIIGTTNESDLFIDPSGNRRYLVIDCEWSRADWPSINAIDFKQLWRQARMEWLNGEQYILSYEDQIHNEERCRTKRVISKEMYAIVSILRKRRSGCAPIVRIRNSEAIVDMEMLLAAMRDEWHEVKVQPITRELETFGFKRVRGVIGDSFVMPEDEFNHLLQLSTEEHAVADKPSYVVISRKDGKQKSTIILNSELMR